MGCFSPKFPEKKTMETINIYRRSREDKDGFARIYASLYVSGEKIAIPVGIKVLANEWDERGHCKGKSKRAKDMNLIIENVRARISDVLVKARLRNVELTKDSFMRQYNNPTDFSTFVEYMRHYTIRSRKTISYNTWRSYRTIIRKIEGYSPKITFRELTPEYLKAFLSHLRKLGNSEPTAYKNLALLKVFVMAAVRDGYIDNNPFDVVQVKKPKNKFVYLVEDELKQLVALYRSNSLEKERQDVLRFFLFMAFTSLHVGDAKRLRVEDIYDGVLHYKRQKTRQEVAIPLSKPAAKLVKYYVGDRQQGTLIVGLPTDQEINRMLKKIVRDAGIAKDVSCKAARHTFASIFMMKNANVMTLKDLMGHTSINTTMVYAHIAESEKLEGVKVFDCFL